MKLKTVKISTLKQHPRNYNIHPKEQLSELQDSLNQFDQVKNIVVWKGQVIAGNGLLEAAKIQKRKTIEVQDVSDWPEEKAISFMIADNRLAELAIMDDDLLSGLLADFDDPLDIPGVDEDFLDGLDLGDGLTEEDKTDPDEIPEVDAPVVKSGELWLLGEHRVLCSDSTVKKNVERLLDGEKADLVFTDPPYGINYSGGRTQVVATKTYGKLENDDLVGSKLGELISQAFNHNKPEADVYICVSPKMQKPFLDYIENNNKVLDAVIVWDKGNAGLGYMAYRRQCEFILFVKGGAFHKGDKSDFDLWSIGKDNTSEYVHGTQKPIAVSSRAIENSSKRNDIVLDLFLGSGSTLIACEKTNRICFGCEIDPHYSTVILQRWADYTGKDPIREDGVKFSSLKNK